MRRWISLGGWCGPSLMLSKMGVRPMEESLPFDMVRCTMDGIVELTQHGFATGYFPGPLHTRPFPADPVSIWLLFRGQHACFTHFDLNGNGVAEELQRRIDAWEALLSPRRYTESGGDGRAGTIPKWVLRDGHRPLTFLRTTIAENPVDEMKLIPSFHAAVHGKTQGSIPFRTVMVMHNQASFTAPMCSIGADTDSPCIVWNLKRDGQEEGGEVTSSAGGDEDADHSISKSNNNAVGIDSKSHVPLQPQRSLFDECHDGYEKIISTMSRESEWTSLLQSLPTMDTYLSKSPVMTPYTELSRVAGIPVVRGTCTGVGSTHGLAQCPFCGSRDGHAVVDPGQFDTNQPWSEAQLYELFLAYASHDGDQVAAVEAIALAQGRGANETLQKLRELTEE